MKPHDGKEFSFTLKDDDGFELVGVGFRYRQSSFKINNFLAYGYNDTSVIVKVTDSLDNIRYLISYETGYRSKRGSPEISFRDLSNSDFEKIKIDYQWFVVSREKADTVMRIKFVSLIGAAVSLIFFIGTILRRQSKGNL